MSLSTYYLLTHLPCIELPPKLVRTNREMWSVLNLTQSFLQYRVTQPNHSNLSDFSLMLGRIFPSESSSEYLHLKLKSESDVLRGQRNTEENVQ